MPPIPRPSLLPDPGPADPARAGASLRLLLPPPFQAFAAGAGDILDLAEARAQDGAGTLLWREADGILALAVVLEPAPPLVTTARAADLGFYAGLGALCDMLARHGQPERRITIAWPDRIYYDGALIAGARWREGPLGGDGLPQWLIFGAEILAERPDLADPGLYPGTTALAEEEFPEAAPLIESLAAFFKLIIDRWAHEGRAAVLRRVLDRVEDKGALAGAAIRAGQLDLPALAGQLRPDLWRDPARGGPKW